MTATAANRGDRAGVEELEARAHAIRRHVLTQASGKGEGYVAQALGIADLLAVMYFSELRYDPARPDWEGRDRFLLSTGHYSIALYAAFAEAGLLDADELPSYGVNGSGLPMSTDDGRPFIEILGGSLGQGLGQGVGMALALRLDASDARVCVELSDGELQEGSTWEAAIAGSSFGLDRLVAIVDCNGIQADGPMVVNIEPVAAKWTAFGWDTEEIDGNDVRAIVAALDRTRAANGRPKCIVLRTVPGKGVPTLEERERAHFVRVEPDEWDRLTVELEQARG
jgi:transketolase